jgi:hypothetical protein
MNTNLNAAANECFRLSEKILDCRADGIATCRYEEIIVQRARMVEAELKRMSAYTYRSPNVMPINEDSYTFRRCMMDVASLDKEFIADAMDLVEINARIARAIC